MLDSEDDNYRAFHTHWFGVPWPFPDLPAPVCEDRQYQVPVPVGEVCTGCSEPVVAEDSGVRIAAVALGQQWCYFHVECWLREVMCPDSVGLGDGTHQHDPARRREEGRLLMAYVREHAAL